MGLNNEFQEVIRWLKVIAGRLTGTSLTSTVITNVTPGTGATDLGKAEDAPHTSSDVGVMALGVRNDAGTALAGTTGDYIPLTTDSVGALRVAITSGAGSGGTALADEGAFVEGTTSFTPVGGVLNETIASDPTEDQAAAFRITPKRALHTNLRNLAGTEIGTAAAPVRTDPTGTTAQPVTDNAGSLTIDNATLAVVGGGTEATALRVTIATDSTGLLSVDDNGASLTVDNPVLSVVGSGTEATAQRVTIATDSTGVLSVDDNGGSLTVDGTVAVSGSVAVTNAALGVTGGGTEATALRVTIANDSTGLVSIDDNGGSLTVDNPALSVVGGGTEATAQRVTIATDSTGVLSVDDNGGSLTVDGTVAVSSSALPTGAATSANQATEIASLATIAALSKAESSAHVSGDPGVQLLAVRNDAGAALALDGQYIPLSVNIANRLRVDIGAAIDGATLALQVNSHASLDTVAGTAWTSATALNTVTAQAVTQHPGIAIGYTRSGAISAGVISFEVLDADGNVFPIAAVRMDTLVAESTFSLSTATEQAWMVDTRGWTTVRVRLSTVITGAGTAIITIGASTLSTPTRTIVNQQRTATSAVTSVAASATNVTLLAANALRLGGSVYNDSTVTMTLKLGATASATSKTLDIYATGYYPIPDGYTGIIDALWASATGSARITELSV